MILFGLYTGQRLGDIATLQWNNLDLVRGELRISTRKTGKTLILPLVAPLRKHMEFLSRSSNEPSAPIHPKAFDLVERQHKTGSLSNQFADLLAAAGLRQKRNHKSTGKGRATRRHVQPLSFHSLRRSRFMPLVCEQTLPLSLWLSFELEERDRLLAVLQFLRPITTPAVWKELAM
jgi:integrase